MIKNEFFLTVISQNISSRKSNKNIEKTENINGGIWFDLTPNSEDSNFITMYAEIGDIKTIKETSRSWE